MPESHKVEIRSPATAVSSIQARGAANDLLREKGEPEFSAGSKRYEEHPWGTRFVCADCGEEFPSRSEAREHARETFPGYGGEEGEE